MNAQELFNKVATHLQTQRVPSEKQDDTGAFVCAYRDDKGNKCAFGCLIPDEGYNETLEGHISSHLFSKMLYPNSTDLRGLEIGPQLALVLTDLLEHQDLIRGLQRAHDGAANAVRTSEGRLSYSELVASRLADVARSNDLHFDSDAFEVGFTDSDPELNRPLSDFKLSEEI
jgi:hypothetical protein